jgi:uncharacterized membrane protein YkvA (DUF1232 family)
MQSLKKLLAILASIVYVISPVDIVPDFLPGIGWVDDLIVVGALLWYLNSQRGGRSPWDVFRERMQGSRRPPPGTPRPEEFAADFNQMDPYTLLEVSPHASPEEIKAAYRRVAARYHPDKVAHLGKEFQELAHQKFVAIQQAYERLHEAGR